MNTITIDLKPVLAGLILPALNHPEFLHVKDQGNENMAVLEVTVHPEDMGKIIGTGGNNILALKSIMLEIGKANGFPVRLLVVEPPALRRNGLTKVEWSIDQCTKALDRLFVALRMPVVVAICPGRPGKSMVFLTPDIPLTLSGPLSRWLNVMGGAHTRLILDDNADT